MSFAFFAVTSQQYLMGSRFSFSEMTADQITSIPNLTSAVLAPFLGALVDRVGKRPFFISLSSLGFVLAHAALFAYPACIDCRSVEAVYLFMGASIALFTTVIWPSIPLVVHP